MHARRRSDDGIKWPFTPDGRYLLVGGRLWRAGNPALPEEARQRFVEALMEARRAVRTAKRGEGDLAAARACVDAAKRGLGERGPVWWTDGAADYNRHIAKNTPYADWAELAKRNELVPDQADLAS
jgi:hypothetical protein